MKRVIAISLATVLLLLTLAGCAPKKEEFTCDMCGQQVTSVPYPVTIDGQDKTICDGCYEGLKDAGLIK